MTNDDLVMRLWNKVKEKKAEISKAQKHKWLTNGSFATDEGNVNTRVNILTEQNVSKLVNLYGFISRAESDFKAAIKELGLNIKFSWMGYSVEDWKADFKARIDQVGLNKKKKELEELEGRLDKLISPDQRRAMELKDIAALLNE